jgi:hypothetical protein
MRLIPALVLLSAACAVVGAGFALAPGAQAAGAAPKRPSAPARKPADPGAPTDDKSGDNAEPEAETAPPTFEALAAPAHPIGEVGTLLASQIEKCLDDKREREIERARCRAITSYLRRALPGKTFSIAADDPAAISVSAYDPAIKGYRLALAACVACSNPIRVGRSEDPVFVTLKKPADAGKSSDSLPAAVEIASVTLPFGSEGEAQAWLRDVRPHLRAELVFTPAASEWRFNGARGYAMALVAGRVVDRCSGTVVLSSPPSTGLADRASAVAAAASDGCPASRRAPLAVVGAAASGSSQSAAGDDDDDDPEEHLASELTRPVIAEAMGRIRAQVFACYERFRVPGSVPLTFEVAGNGSVQSVKLSGSLTGTPTGDCVVEAARGAKFPRFDGPVQTFTYPFFLRR